MAHKLFGTTALLVVGLAVVGGTAFRPIGALALEPGPECQTAKLNSSAKQPKCRANVFAKSIKKVEAPDAAKLAKCDDKFDDGFTKAESKGGIGCPTTGDAGTIEGLLDACIDGVISDLGGAPGGGGEEAKCQSKKAKAAGKYAQCRIKADSTAIKKAAPADYTKCDAKLSDKWAKIEAKPPCLTTGDLNAVKADVDACQATVAFALTGLCGNGSPNPGEQCDDGNTTSGDGCSDLCVLEFSCGDGNVNAGEQCDDGNTTSGDGCSNLCIIEFSCGDGNVNAGEQCDDGNTTSGDGCSDLCVIEVSCGDGNVNAGEQCDDGNLINGDGCSDQCTVEGTVEYSQGFESLVKADPQALALDGWLVGANVFAGPPPGGAFLYNYFSFPAPNGGPSFSAIEAGQGGPGQGAQQLSIYSDYNNGDHGNGNTIEALVFRERTIVAGDVGKTLTFQFEAKLGNLELLSTAVGFIKTINPGAGFATTNLVEVNMTSIPATWATYSMTLAIDAPLVGQILQYGFGSRATLYQGSGILYDNIVLSSVGGAPPPVCGDGIAEGSEQCDDSNLVNGDGCDDQCKLEAVPGEYAINGDFETGNKTGWTEFLNNGSFTVSMANANGGLWSGNLVASVPGGGGPASFPVIKQANIGVGSVVPGGTVTVKFDLKGSIAGAGGVVFAEMFSEISGGGTSKSEIITGAPLFPTPPNDWTAGWVSYSFNLTLGPDVSGGVTLQLKTDCGANPGCTVDVFFDNVSVTVP